MSTKWKGQTVHMTLHNAPHPHRHFKTRVQSSEAGLGKATCTLPIMQLFQILLAFEVVLVAWFVNLPNMHRPGFESSLQF